MEWWVNSKWPKWWKIGGPILFIVAFAMFVWLKPSIHDIVCEQYKELKSVEWEGVVEEKFIDNEQHAYPIIVLNTKSNQNRLNLVNDKSTLFESIKAGDYINKNAGSYEVTVTSGQTTNKFVLDFGCN